MKPKRKGVDDLLKDLEEEKKEMESGELLPHFDKPSRIPLIVVSYHPILPGMFIPIVTLSTQDIKAVDYAIQGNSFISLFVLKSKYLDKHDNDSRLQVNYDKDIYEIGVIGKIIKKINLPDGGYHIFVSIIDRVKFLKLIINEKFPIIEVEYLEEVYTDMNDIEVKALYGNIILKIKEILSYKKMPEMQLNIVNIDDKSKLCDTVASLLAVSKEAYQEVLETLDIKKRLNKVLELIYEELNLIEVQNKISNTIQEKLKQQQKEFFLKEELKAIKAELGVGNEKSVELIKLKKKIALLNLKGEVLEVVGAELEKFSYLEVSSSEYVVSRNYLELITELPWKDTKVNFDKLDLSKAKKILDKNYYGMDEVKDRILEYISVLKLIRNKSGTIILLVGPPGIGKTSIGKVIAEVLKTKFFRFSVGGMRDEAEIKGHRRTYVGSLPGKIIQGLRIVKTNAPVFLIDEIDKVSASSIGDPFATLLEVLDPEQNINFRDNYLDLPFDISSVVFILTANSLGTIPSPLLNRMEIIELSGYVDLEKVEIARKYLIPKILKENGLTKDNIKFQTSSLTEIVEKYARDSGIRTFEKYLNKVCRKIARKLLENQAVNAYSITSDNLEEYISIPVFRKDELLTNLNSGIVVGLAWTNFGGSILIVESVKTESTTPGIKLTGSLGEVMKESASIAYTYVNSIRDKLLIEKEFFEKYMVHIHLPEGAIPKDGPSAGITLASTLISLALNRCVKPHLAMTGELSLTGNVMAIGGLKEKIIAAKRNGIKYIILPRSNLVNLEQISMTIKDGIIFHLVSNMDEVIKLLF